MIRADQGSTTVALSQNELGSLSMKAARGAGYSWGLAEEAGFATSWLAARGLDATAVLLALLTNGPGQTAAPRPTPGHWQSPGQHSLCPIALGAALTDSAMLTEGPFSQDTDLDPVAAPMLLLPFFCRAAQLRTRPFTIGWSKGRFQIGKDGSFDCMAAACWMGQTAIAMTLYTGPLLEATVPYCKRGEIPTILKSVFDSLSALALNTTVPATDTSRRGAGSATPDTD